ncbi:SAM-dependent methyltransferase [Mycetocola sp. CAN_C7]|uniref:class I SAM-dependent methyltransferase n=1 Tax=Mycetocola sp. CAN_C7 TaxID=2787724 RepID=UPI0018C8E08C
MSGGASPGIWGHGSAYERYVGRWSRRVAPVFLSWLDIPPGRRWLDVGCGTGALTAAVADACEPRSLDGVEPSEGFLSAARASLGGRARLRSGSAEAIPLTDRSVDAVVSGLVLNFVPDAASALAEMTRVCRHGGHIAAYVWDYGDRMELMRYFWAAAIEQDPSAESLDEASRFEMCNPRALRVLFASAGLVDVDVAAIDIATEFADFDDYWEPFLGGQGVAPGYVMSLDGASRDALRDRLRARLPMQADGSISLVARVWAVRGTME